MRSVVDIGIVTPHAGVWIESMTVIRQTGRCTVTPLAGVWVERAWMCMPRKRAQVTPLGGVWIERGYHSHCDRTLSSLPLRECGLKTYLPRCQLITSHIMTGNQFTDD